MYITRWGKKCTQTQVGEHNVGGGDKSGAHTKNGLKFITIRGQKQTFLHPLSNFSRKTKHLQFIHSPLWLPADYDSVCGLLIGTEHIAAVCAGSQFPAEGTRICTQKTSNSIHSMSPYYSTQTGSAPFWPAVVDQAIRTSSSALRKPQEDGFKCKLI
jgi:hypothetical protein